MTHILDRAEFSRLVAGDIEGWQWPDKTDEQWDEAIQDLKERHGTELSARNVKTLAKLGWDQRLKILHDLTTTIVRLGRLRYRANPDRARVFDFVKPDAKSRASILGAAERLAELWRQLDAAWVPLEEVTLEGFDLLLVQCAEIKQQSLASEVTWILSGAAVDEAATALDADCVAWYATATAVFPEDTSTGRLIRHMVPTTTVPQPAPDQAVISNVTTGAGGMIRSEFTAPHGTRFTVLHQGPGEKTFVPVVVDTKEKFIVLKGQAAGEHRFKVIASNSRGEGPESAETVVTLAEELAA